MEAVATFLEGLALAEWLRGSRWGYASVNAIHIFGIALLIGGSLPLGLRLLGCWASLDAKSLYRVLAPVAATGLLVAIASGLLLFATRAGEYLLLDLFLIKLSLIAIGAVHAATLHLGGFLRSRSTRRKRLAALLSLLLWPAVLVCGRFLAFV